MTSKLLVKTILQCFCWPSNFKTYDELKEKLNGVIMGQRNTEAVENVDMRTETTGLCVLVEVMYNLVHSSDDDDTMSYFSKLADED